MLARGPGVMECSHSLEHKGPKGMAVLFDVSWLTQSTCTAIFLAQSKVLALHGSTANKGTGCTSVTELFLRVSRFYIDHRMWIKRAKDQPQPSSSYLSKICLMIV